MKKCAACETKLIREAQFCHACGCGVVDIVEWRAAASMVGLGKREGRKIRAKLSQRSLGRMKGLSKQAQGFLDDVPISSKSFPDESAHRAVIKIADVLLDTIQVLHELSDESISPETIELLDEAAVALESEVAGEGQDIEDIELDEQGPSLEEPTTEDEGEFTLDELGESGEDVVIEEPMAVVEM